MRTDWKVSATHCPPMVEVMHRANSLADDKSSFQCLSEVAARLQNGCMELLRLRENGGNRRSQRAAGAVCVLSVDPRAADGVEFPTVEEEINYFAGSQIAF